jgi:O-antigen/teichoic acid export membrane protein
MLVLLAHRYRDQGRSYLLALLRAHVVFSLLTVGLVVLATELVLREAEDAELRHALHAMACAAPFMNLAQLVRRVCYARRATRAAALGALLHLLLIGAGFSLLARARLLSPTHGYALMALCSLLVSVLWLARLPARDGERTKLSFRDVARAHLGYARFGVLTALLGWAPLNLWYLALPLLQDGPEALGSSGHFRALVNLVQPMLQVNGALATLLVPTFARQLASAGRMSPMRPTLLLTAASALYCPLLVWLGPHADRLLYRGAYPTAVSSWLALGAVPACYACFSSLRAYCLARELPALPFQASIAAALGCATLGLYVCAWRPPLGASLAMLLGFAIQALALVWIMARRRDAPAVSAAA